MIFQPELETQPREQRLHLQQRRLQALLPRFGHDPDALLRELPFTVKAELRDAYPFGLLQVPLEQTIRVHASSGTRGKPTIVAYTRARHRDLRGGVRACARGGRRVAERRAPRRVRLRPLHRRPRAALRRRAARRDGRAGLRRQHCAAVAAARGPRRNRTVLHAELRVAARRTGGRARHQPSLRRVRRRAVVGGDAREARVGVGDRRVRHLRPLGGHGPGSRGRVP